MPPGPSASEKNLYDHPNSLKASDSNCLTSLTSFRLNKSPRIPPLPCHAGVVYQVTYRCFSLSSPPCNATVSVSSSPFPQNLLIHLHRSFQKSPHSQQHGPGSFCPYSSCLLKRQSLGNGWMAVFCQRAEIACLTLFFWFSGGDEGERKATEIRAGSSSYIYSKFSLPITKQEQEL